MEYKKESFEHVQEGKWDSESCVRCIAGLDFDKTCLPDGMKRVPKGAVLAKKLTSSGYKAVIVKTAVAQANAAASATSLKVLKGHLLKVGDKIAGSTISAIDTSNEDYDTLTVGALAAKVDKDTVANDDNVDNILGLNYATTKMDSYPSVTYTIQAYEIEEAPLPYPINAAIKEKLTCRHHFALDFSEHAS